MTNPTIAIISGASTVPELYAPLQSAFETKGYPTVVTEPPSITSADATTVTLDTDVEYVRLSVLAPLLAEGKDVVLLLHSYGGAYGAAAAQGLSKTQRLGNGEKGGVVGIVYAASFVVEPGQNALEALAVTDLAGSGIVPGVCIHIRSTLSRMKCSLILTSPCRKNQEPSYSHQPARCGRPSRPKKVQSALQR